MNDTSGYLLKLIVSSPQGEAVGQDLGVEGSSALVANYVRLRGAENARHYTGLSGGGATSLRYPEPPQTIITL